jgi:uracil-DNA glycosylase
MDVKIQQEWKEVLEEEFKKDYFKNLVEYLHKEKESGQVIYPPGSLIFNAFNLTPFSKVKVVILGQDPYHNPGQAHGLSFSVPEGVIAPPSLKNIYKEIEADLGISLQGKGGNLEGWARQGVFMLNAILTVRAGVAASHSRIGWEKFTDAVIQTLSDRKTGVVFMLWGNFARSKKALIDSTKHTVLEAAHPISSCRGSILWMQALFQM